MNLLNCELNLNWTEVRVWFRFRFWLMLNPHEPGSNWTEPMNLQAINIDCTVHKSTSQGCMMHWTWRKYMMASIVAINVSLTCKKRFSCVAMYYNIFNVSYYDEMVIQKYSPTVFTTVHKVQSSNPEPNLNWTGWTGSASSGLVQVQVQWERPLNRTELNFGHTSTHW